jgi:hypothetical protein
MKASDGFERQIHSIHELLEKSGAGITWNDHIPDPDNLKQKRQVDITIRRGQHLTLVECRLHSAPQDVTWIEELIGRRQSLGADAVLAVSSSGFTSGAIAKAHRYDVTIRDLLELTDDEVRSWSRSVALTLFFYQYSDLKISVVFKKESLPRLDSSLLKADLVAFPGLRGLFNSAAELMGQELRPCAEHVGRGASFVLRATLEAFRLCGEPVVEVIFEGRAHLVAHKIDSPVVRAYGAPGLGPNDREATIEDFPLGDTSVVHDGTRVAVLLDISQVEMPPFCLFRFVEVSGQEEMDHEVFELVGVEKLWVPGGAIRINVVGVEDSTA